MATVDTLKSIGTFGKFQPEEYEEVAPLFEEKLYSTGSKIFTEGDPSSSLFFIASGSVEIFKEETVLATAGPGDFFGEMALFEYAPRSAGVRAVEDALVLEISKDNFDAIILERPAIGAKLLYTMMEEMSRRLRKSAPGKKQSFFF